MSRWVSVISGQSLDPKEDHAKGRGLSTGCMGCPLDRGIPGVRKVKALKDVTGRKAMLWLPSPGAQATRERTPLVDRSGKWLLKILAKYGFSRDDFDIQYVLRCRPFDPQAGCDREPTKKELHQCSLYTTEALGRNGGAAKLHLVFGMVARRALLGSEFRMDVPVFWSERLNARVVCFDHPSYFTENKYAPWRYSQFKGRLRVARYFYDHPGKWTFLKESNFKWVRQIENIRALFTQMKEASKKRRISVDIEAGPVTRSGKWGLLMVGFSWAKDQARTIVIDHPDGISPHRDEIVSLLRDFLDDPTIRKTFQYGSSDCEQLKNLLGLRVRGYDYDTTYGHYLRYTFLRSHSLESIANEGYPEYAGYKNYIKPYLKDPNKGYTQIPLPILATYNCADAALTKRVELDTSKFVSGPLVKTYIWAGMTLDKMQERGPYLDRTYLNKVLSILPGHLKRVTHSLQSLADDPNFDAKKAHEVARVLYDKLKLEAPDGKRSTSKEVLTKLTADTGHPFPKLVSEFRSYSKMMSTYVKAYVASADKNGGELRTKWYLTGAVTGRLRCGGGKDGHEGTVNFQNLHGDALLQNLLVSDMGWRDLLEMAEERKGVWSWDHCSNRFSDYWVNLALDYSQIEIRMLAECSGDPLLIQQFNTGQDIHCLVGHTLTGWPVERIAREKKVRTFVKNLHFGMVYGLSEEGLFYYISAKGIKTTQQKVSKAYKAYFKAYKGVGRFIEYQREFARKHGYVETLFGFRRGIGVEEGRKTNPENQAINSPIQGSAHHLLLTSLALLSLKPKTFHLLQEPIAEVHDALVFKLRLSQLPAAYKQAKFLMEKAAPDTVRKWYGRKLHVPLLAEASAGFRYGVMADYAGEDPLQFMPVWRTKNEQVEASVAETYFDKRKAA